LLQAQFFQEPILIKNQRLLSFENLETRRLLTATVLTNQEQLLLELINRARSNPTDEAIRNAINLNDGLPAGTLNGTPKQPLSPNQLLINAAGLHSQDMLDNNYFEHINLQGKNPGARIADTGYVASTWAENIATSFLIGVGDRDEDVYLLHSQLFVSPGHRVNILDDRFNEAGMGVRYDEYSSNGNAINESMVTEKFAARNNRMFITGVAYSDLLDDDSFYTVGEGLSGLTVVAVKSNGEKFETQIGTSGGYAIEVNSGTYTVTFSAGPLKSPVSFSNVIVSGKNVKVDLNTSQIVKLSLSIDKRSISENSGSLTAMVSRPGATTSALQVDISSNQRSEADFPTSINIPAGSASATFSVMAVNDLLPDGDTDVAIEVSANDHAVGKATFKVIDDDLLVARPDQQMTLRNQSVDVSVVSNDIFPNSQLVDLIVEITSPPNPTQGIANVVSQRIHVSPVTDFEGIITVAYRIRDPRVGVSEPAILKVGVAASHKQNALAPLDVDANGTVAPSDALIVINLLNDSNATRQVEEMPSPLLSPFVDVTGNGSVTPTDALLIINALNTRSSSGEGESLSQAKMVDIASFDIEQTWESRLLRRVGLSKSKRK
jgi:Dockerin type I domain/Cysteine-rich secretory protein family